MIPTKGTKVTFLAHFNPENHVTKCNLYRTESQQVLLIWFGCPGLNNTRLLETERHFGGIVSLDREITSDDWLRHLDLGLREEEEKFTLMLPAGVNPYQYVLTYYGLELVPFFIYSVPQKLALERFKDLITELEDLECK